MHEFAIFDKIFQRVFEGKGYFEMGYFKKGYDSFWKPERNMLFLAASKSC